MSLAKEFELVVRKRLDEKFERPVHPSNPLLKLMDGDLPLDDCRQVFRDMWDSLMVFNRVLLPRLLERAPTLPLRVELMKVVAVEYGPHLENAHPILFRNLLEGLGVEMDDLPWFSDLESGPCAHEVQQLRGMNWCQMLARILVGESIGPVSFTAVAEAMQKHYGFSDHTLAYFTIHAQHDKADTEVLLQLIREQARTDEAQSQVLAVIDGEFDKEGRYALYGCKLPGTSSYRYERRYDRRRISADM